MYLENIYSPADVKKLSFQELNDLSHEIRASLLQKLSEHGGHFGPNFGMVEATIALHYVFNSPKDKIVYDVSHQSYVHKMLTGRKDAFLHPAEYDHVSGYSEPQESEHDFFVIGHTSTSISLASGLAKGRDLTGGNENIIAVIGDGSLSGGEAFEGLDYVAELGTNMIIIVNDNQMSIAENHGGLYKNLKDLRDSNGQCECNFFKAMGLDYMYVNDGNHVEALIEAFSKVKDIQHPIVVHINTLKGKGYEPAEQDKETYHWRTPFDLETGESKMNDDAEDYSEVTAQYLLKKMKEDKRVVTITSGTPAVLGFTPDRRQEAGKQFVDVGIAEEHAVTMAAAMALDGLKPVVAIYSTFLQRAYDQMIHDVALQQAPVVFAIDRAGLVGDDGATHHGVFDLAYLRQIPGMIVMAPKDENELQHMLYTALHCHQPAAIRYPRGEGRGIAMDETLEELAIGQGELLTQDGEITLLAVGSMVAVAEETAQLLAERYQLKCTIINARFVKPLDEQLILAHTLQQKLVVTMEEGILAGGFGSAVLELLSAQGRVLPPVLRIGIEDGFVAHGATERLKADAGLTADKITARIAQVLSLTEEGE